VESLKKVFKIDTRHGSSSKRLDLTTASLSALASRTNCPIAADETKIFDKSFSLLSPEANYSYLRTYQARRQTNDYRAFIQSHDSRQGYLYNQV
jgi:hypothetical protein